MNPKSVIAQKATRPQRGTAPVGSNGAPGWINLLGVRVAAVNLDDATGRVLEAVRRRTRGYICVRDAHGLIRCQDDPELRQIHNKANMVVPDGMPLVWALRRAGYANAGRVYGPDLMLAVFGAGQAQGIRHYLYGTTDEVLHDLGARLKKRFGGAEIVGSYAPPFRPLDEAERVEVAARINAAAPDIIWVGLSTPKQERWMAEMRPLLEAPVLAGVGAAFDFHAGRKRQAPGFLQKNGLEWAFRLMTEPRRLWRRYARTVPSFILLDAGQRLGLLTFPIGDAAEIETPAAVRS
jgi:N-acetylglucosaminyldiphosphoundecaprenol N-acetyl-beta-D-mannosaminyltransferase